MKLIRYYVLFPVVIAFIACADDSPARGGKKADSSAVDHVAHSKPTGDQYCDNVNRGIITTDTMRSSPRRVAMKTIGDTHIHIDYSSPGVKGRTVWGGLVAYDQVWVTGAHKATSIEFNKPVTINGQKIDAGKYAIFTIPGKEKWTIILNKKYDQHLADEYTEADDVMRMIVTPNPSSLTQRLTYEIEKADSNKAAVHIRWERIQVTLPIEI